MTVPTYSVIANSEIDPESPITTSLVTRLRDNPLALFQIDPATSTPTATVPGQQIYINKTAGTYTNDLTIPAGVGLIKYRSFGPGGKSSATIGHIGGSGEVRIGTLAVTPGESLSFVIGAGGTATDGAATASTLIKRGSTVLVESKGGNNCTAGAGAIGGTGGSGGTSFPGNPTTLANDLEHNSFSSNRNGPGGATFGSNGSDGGVIIDY